MGGLATRIYGQRPSPGASKIEQLRYVRRLAYLTTLPWLLLVIAFLVFEFGSGFSDGVAFTVGCMWLLGFGMISLSIRRERLRGTRQGPP